MRARRARVTARDVALAALVRVEGGAYANVALPAALRASALDARERAQATDLVYGTLRRQRALDHLLEQVMDRDLDDLDPPVRAALRIGTRQLVEGVRPHAAVSATVDAAAKVAPRARGYVNAVLRQVAELGPPWPWPEGADPASVAVRASMPDWVVELLVEDIGLVAALGVVESASRPAALTLRPNPLRTDPDALAAELEAGGASVGRGELVPDALVVLGAGDPAVLPAIAGGRATPQDQASQAVAASVGAVAGQRVLEIGAAPGGKVSAIAELMGDDGLVVAVDVDAGRLRLVTDARARLGLRAVVPVQADGHRLPLRVRSFDRVLLDAPCTGLGVLRRRPEARWRLRPEQVFELADLQRELLHSAAELVCLGGLLVYSVCTLTAAETRDVGEWAVGTLGDFVPEAPPGAPWEPDGPGARLLPQAAGTDGMWLLRLRRTGEPRG